MPQVESVAVVDEIGQSETKKPTLERRVIFLAPEQVEEIQKLAEGNYTTFSQQLRVIVAEGLRRRTER